MSDLEAKFEQAAKDVQSLSQRPDNDTLLELYALYKQGSQGDVDGKRPGMMQMVKRAKWDAWHKLQGTSKDKAMEKYIALVEKLRG